MVSDLFQLRKMNLIVDAPGTSEMLRGRGMHTQQYSAIDNSLVVVLLVSRLTGSFHA